MRIRGFLLAHPKPSIVRVSGDGEPAELRPGKSYAKCAETVAALDGTLLECLTADRQLIRAMKLTGAEAQQPEPIALPPSLANDPHAAMLTHFANLISRAYEHTTEVAFTKMVEMAERLNERSQTIEERLERAEALNRKMRDEQVDEAFERAEEVAEKAGIDATGSDFVQNMASAFLSGQLQKPAAPSTTKAPLNGKGTS